MLRLAFAYCHAETIEAECIDMNQRKLVLRSGRKACDNSSLLADISLLEPRSVVDQPTMAFYKGREVAENAPERMQGLFR
jgi:hypothetical protein